MNKERLKNELTKILLHSFLFVGEKTTRGEACVIYKHNPKVRFYITTQVHKILKLLEREGYNGKRKRNKNGQM